MVSGSVVGGASGPCGIGKLAGIWDLCLRAVGVATVRELGVVSRAC